jgi:hypothetical protein
MIDVDSIPPQDVAGAQAYFDRRSDFLQKNADGIAETLQMKKAAYARMSLNFNVFVYVHCSW